MTKPEFAPEPSMEDILASIRKMISEDRLGPRTVPDQVARVSLGEHHAATPAAKSNDTVVQVSEPRAAEPLPKAMERPVPSFSSLSDALKSAAAAQQVRRTSLDDKLSGLLSREASAHSDEPASAPGTTEPPAPLTMLSASRPASATPGEPDRSNEPTFVAHGRPLGLAQMENAQPEPTSDRVLPPASPDATIGAGPALGERGALSGLRGWQGDHRPDTPQVSPQLPQGAPSVSEAPPPIAADDKEDERTLLLPQEPESDAAQTNARGLDSQTVIVMPSRFSGATGGPRLGSVTNGSALNGLHSTVIGLRQQPDEGPHADEPAPANSDATLEALVESVFGEPATNGADDGPSAPLKLFDPGPILPVDDQDIAQSEPELDPFAANGMAGPAGIDSPASSMTSVLGSAERFAGTSPALAFGKSVGVEPSESRAAAAGEPVATDAEPDPAAPSESLIDAVMEMVQAEPASLSVLTSGANFIHGARPEGDAAAANPAEMPRLDGAAAELLRPMLRQWLADNMPRIVEDALRSELMSTLGASPPGSSGGPKKA